MVGPLNPLSVSQGAVVAKHSILLSNSPLVLLQNQKVSPFLVRL